MQSIARGELPVEALVLVESLLGPAVCVHSDAT
jgi:hypothetical protein